MFTLHTSVDDARRVWDWCAAAWARCGHILRFPEGTDPQKTYQWRSVKRLAEKFYEWGFDDTTSQAFICCAASYAKDRRLLRKGLTIFFQSNIMEICYERLSKKRTETEFKLDAIQACKRFLSAQPPNALLSRKTPDAYYNIIEWYNAGYLSKVFLAISKSCTTALHHLDGLNTGQRRMLPSAAALYCLWKQVSDNSETGRQMRGILGDDWRRM